MKGIISLDPLAVTPNYLFIYLFLLFNKLLTGGDLFLGSGTEKSVE